MNPKTYTSLSALALIVLLATSCIRQGEDPCPTGAARLHLYVEKFRNRSQDPLSDREPVFSARVGHLRYYLYHEEELRHPERIVDLFPDETSPCYDIDLTGLDYGDYRIVIVANSTRAALGGDPVSAHNLVITYPGVADTEDFFTAVFDFRVSEEAVRDYEIGLLRTQGVVRYTFRNMPQDVSAFEIVMENVATQKWVTGDYMLPYQALRRYDLVVPLTRQSAAGDTEAYVIGTFPTLADEHTTYTLRLYAGGEQTPFRTQRIVDNLRVERNQLLDITTIFNQGDISFLINVDSDWDGSTPGGGSELD
jgi:hypothetical protein